MLFDFDVLENLLILSTVQIEEISIRVFRF